MDLALFCDGEVVATVSYLLIFATSRLVSVYCLSMSLAAVPAQHLQPATRQGHNLGLYDIEHPDSGRQLDHPPFTSVLY